MHYEYHPEKLRVAYRAFLDAKYPNLKAKSVKTKVDDVFAVLNWVTEDEFWGLIALEPEDLNRKREFFADEFLSQRANPMKDARGYIRALQEFKTFIEILCLIEDAIWHKPRKIEPSNRE